MKPEIAKAITVIDHAQAELWNMSHKIRDLNEKLGIDVWQWTLQIEHAVKVLREELDEKPVI